MSLIKRTVLNTPAELMSHIAGQAPKGLIARRPVAVAATVPVAFLPLHNKYRPKELIEIVGQEAVVANLSRLVATGRVPHMFLFTGPSGTGKTTLARILAEAMQCERVEVDAAKYNSVEQARELVGGAKYQGIGKRPNRAYIIDECHALSKAAWQPFLLATEEPPAHVYWFFCTTEAEKVPKTIQTRAHAYDLSPVAWEKIADHLLAVSVQENLSITEDFIALAARRAMGSVRQALVYLSQLDGITSKDLAIQILTDLDEKEGGPIELARMLVSGKNASWPNCQKLLQDLVDVNPETIRLTVLNYAAAVLLNARTEKDARNVLAVLQSFSQPCIPSERMAPIMLACGGLFLGQ